MSSICKKRKLCDIYYLEEYIYDVNFTHSNNFYKKDAIDLTNNNDSDSDSDDDYEYTSDYDDDESKKLLVHKSTIYTKDRMQCSLKLHCEDKVVTISETIFTKEYTIDDENRFFLPPIKKRRVGEYNFNSNYNKSKKKSFENDINKEKSHRKGSDNNKEKRKSITYKQKHQLLEKQKYRCANTPNSGVVKTKEHQNYCCPFWKLDNGTFDESGFEADHIVEFNKSNDNTMNNFQLLCCPCHSVKTKRCAQYSWKYSSQEMDNGHYSMEIR
jgi:hypothetical protein